MLITVTAVTDDGGEEIVYSYDTDKNSQCLLPGADEKPQIIEAVREALAFLEGTSK